MMIRGSLVLLVLCGCAQLRTAGGTVSRPTFAAALLDRGDDYFMEEKKPGGWDARVGLALPMSNDLSVGPRFDFVKVSYYKAETLALEYGVGFYAMFIKQLLAAEQEYDHGWVYAVPLSCMGKYFFELIYGAKLRVYAGLGIAFCWGGTIGEPALQINKLDWFSVPFCFGIQIRREEMAAIEVEVRFDSPKFADLEVGPPASPITVPGDADLGVAVITVNWKGVF